MAALIINFLIWVVCVPVIGQAPLFVRWLVMGLKEALADGELLIASTIIAGAAVERASVRLRAHSRQHKKVRLQVAEWNALWGCLIVSVLLMLASIVWYTVLFGRGASEQAIRVSPIFLGVAVMLGGATVAHDDR